MINRLVSSKFTLLLLGFLFVRIALMALAPVLGDEAYYIYWGMHPAGGYYDLPPMIGWWLAPFTQISLAPFWLRLPNLISLVLISFSIAEWLGHGVSKIRAQWVAALFFLFPLPFLGVVMFPDIPLLFFSYFSAYLFFRAVTVRRQAVLSFLFSGALFGAAVLSKYFAGFLVPAYAVWFFTRPALQRPQGKVEWTGWFWFALGGLPFAFQHYLWNDTHCWSNIVFNFVTRQNVNDGPLYQVLALFLLYIVVVSSPLLWSLFRSRLQLDRADESINTDEWISSLSRFLNLLWAVPLGIFTFTAILGRGQGLHWLLYILPFFVMWCGLRIEKSKFELILKRLFAITGVLSAMGLALAIFPETILKPFFQNRLQFEFAHLTHREAFIETILPDIRANDAVFTEGYTFSSIINYDLQRYARATHQVLPEVQVWGSGSRFGRVFDWTSNFAALDQKRILIVTPGWLPGDIWPPYFKNFKREERDFAGTHFHVTTADQFNASLYFKDEFRKPVETYYRNLGRACPLWTLTHP